MCILCCTHQCGEGALKWCDSEPVRQHRLLVIAYRDILTRFGRFLIECSALFTKHRVHTSAARERSDVVIKGPRGISNLCVRVSVCEGARERRLLLFVFTSSYVRMHIECRIWFYNAFNSSHVRLHVGYRLCIIKEVFTSSHVQIHIGDRLWFYNVFTSSHVHLHVGYRLWLYNKRSIHVVPCANSYWR